MPSLNRLTTLKVAKATHPGLYGDGGGLYLQITKAGVKSWLFRYMIAGKAKAIGLGPLHTVSLAQAREEAQKCRAGLLAGVPPIGMKERHKQALAAHALTQAKTMMFRQCAEAYINAHKDGWKNDKHIAQWQSTLEAYAYPVAGDFPVDQVDIAVVTKVLEPIWKTKTETASRLRGRIEAVLDWATVRGYRSGENPARWKGNLDNLLPKRSKVQKVAHHAALPYAELPAFMLDLSAQSGVAAKALKFLILTATRTNEVIGARWDEIDLQSALWIIPAERMKAGKAHRAPLSPSAVDILKGLKGVSGSYVFPGLKPDKPLSNMAMLKLLKRMGRDNLTVHGFRSTFRDWVGETTTYPREVVEAALAHTIKDKAEAAYARGDLFAKRRHMMDDWADWCKNKINASECSEK